MRRCRAPAVPLVYLAIRALQHAGPGYKPYPGIDPRRRDRVHHVGPLDTLTGNVEEPGSGESPELFGSRVDGVDVVTELACYPVLETIGSLVVRQEPQRLYHPSDP